MFTIFVISFQHPFPRDIVPALLDVHFGREGSSGKIACSDAKGSSVSAMMRKFRP